MKLTNLIAFSGFWSVIYRPHKLCQIFLWLCASLEIPTSGKNFLVIPFEVPEILGGCFHPLQMLLSCLKRQMTITVIEMITTKQHNYSRGYIRCVTLLMFLFKYFFSHNLFFDIRKVSIALSISSPTFKGRSLFSA